MAAGGFSASFPLPPLGEAPDLEDEGDICQSVTVDSCAEEARRFNMGLPLPHDEESMVTGEEDEEEETRVPINIAGEVVSVPMSVLMQLMARGLVRPAGEGEEEEEEGEGEGEGEGGDDDGDGDGDGGGDDDGDGGEADAARTRAAVLIE